MFHREQAADQDQDQQNLMALVQGWLTYWHSRKFRGCIAEADSSLARTHEEAASRRCGNEAKTTGERPLLVRSPSARRHQVEPRHGRSGRRHILRVPSAIGRRRWVGGAEAIR